MGCAASPLGCEHIHALAALGQAGSEVLQRPRGSGVPWQLGKHAACTEACMEGHFRCRASERVVASRLARTASTAVHYGKRFADAESRLFDCASGDIRPAPAHAMLAGAMKGLMHTIYQQSTPRIDLQCELALGVCRCWCQGP